MSSPKSSQVDFDPGVVTQRAIEAYREQLERVRLQRLQERIEAGHAKIVELQKVCRDLKLDDLVDIPLSLRRGAMPDDSEGCEARLRELSSAVDNIQEQILDAHRQRLMESKSDLRELAKIAASSGMDCVTVGRFRGSLDTEIKFARDSRDKAAVTQYLESASKLLEKFARDNPEHSVSSETITLVDDLKMATDGALARNILGRFKSALKSEADQSRRVREEAERHLAARERARSRVAVGTVVANTLEEMGYTVSGIDETCFVKDGHLYAQGRDDPDHAVRITVGSGGKRLVSTPIRLESNEAMAADTSVGGSSDADKRFDKKWCSNAGLGQLHKRLKGKGLATGFSVIDKKAPPVVRVARSETPELLERPAPATKGRRKRRQLDEEFLDLLADDDQLMEK